MRKILILFTVFTLASQYAGAQMTDNQVVSYAKQRKAAGADKKAIAEELIASGVTKEQLQRIAEDNGHSTGVPSSLNTASYMRENNGETAPQTTSSRTSDIFGHDIFRSRLLTFEPNMNIATPQNYVLGTGDELIIDVYGNSQSSEKYKVAPDGTVTIPRLGPVSVAGMTADAAQKRIASVLGPHYDNSSIKLSVGQTRTISINVMGEVVAPGTYTLSAFATVFHALYMAGGINDIGTLRYIQVARKGRIVAVVDIYEYILKGRLGGNVHLQDNDVIIVGPYSNIVSITGHVRRPMRYEMKNDETLSTLIQFAGELTGSAYYQNVSVERTAGERKSVHTVGMGDFNSFVLLDQDAVIVKGNEDRYSNSIVINGAVRYPGNYELGKATTFRSLIELAGGLLDDAQTNRAVLIRTKPDLTKEAITIDIAGILDGREVDMVLQNEDVITIGSKARLNAGKTVTIEGEVYNPGTMAYADELTIEDLIIMAGGLRESASLLNVEVARRIIDPSAEKEQSARSEKFTFRLNEDLSIESDNRFVLKPFDQVYIRRSPVYNAQQRVNISGEIMFAGNYVLDNQVTRISDIIKRAGGFKEKASIANARLIRTMTAEEKARRQQKIELAEDSADSLGITVTEMSNQYSVGINLAKAMDNPGSDMDIVLRDGDQIIIPQYNSTVTISGEVLYPNTVTYIDGMKKKYYIEAAGGYTKESIRHRAYIVYANGEVAKLSKGEIKPGCEIIVPQKIHHDNSATTMKWVSISSTIVATLAVIANLLR